MSIKRDILNPLLSKYESSVHFRNEAKVNRRVVLQLRQPLYDFENPTNKLAVHRVIDDLNKKGIIRVHWVQGEEGNIIQQVELDLDNVHQAYKEINRKPKHNLLREAIEDLQQFTKTSHQWLNSFATQQIENIGNRHSLPQLVPEDRHQRQHMLKCLCAIAQSDGEEMLERVFSKRTFGDSKYFEQNLRANIASILKGWLFQDAELSTNEALQQAGLHRSSDELLFCGAFQVQFRGRAIDFGDFIHGSAMKSRMVKEMNVTGFQGEEVVTIENKASYREFCDQMDLRKTTAVYLGGFPGPAKRTFLNKLYSFAHEHQLCIKFRHWGDIDLGGFRIFVATKQAVPTLEPFLMDKETLLKYKNHGQRLTKAYRRKLTALLKDESYQLFWDTIEEMLAEDIRLEQEAVLLE